MTCSRRSTCLAIPLDADNFHSEIRIWRMPITVVIQDWLRPVSVHHGPQPRSASLAQYSHRRNSKARYHQPSS